MQEQISTRIWQVCDNAKLDFWIDERIDKKTFKRGRLAAKFSAKLTLRERLPELLDSKDWTKRIAIVDDHNAKGGHLSYWDHLPTDEWMPPFDSEAKEQAYAEDFNQIYEQFLGPILHSFVKCTWQQ